MSYVAINTLEVPDTDRDELERRFAARRHAVDGAPGFEGFQLLRPVGGQDRYFVLTQWASREDFEAWRTERAPSSHGGGPPVSTAAELLEFEVVDLG